MTKVQNNKKAQGTIAHIHNIIHKRALGMPEKQSILSRLCWGTTHQGRGVANPRQLLGSA